MLVWLAQRCGRWSFIAAVVLDQFARPYLGIHERDYFRWRVLRVRINDPSLAHPYPRLVGASDLSALQPPAVLATIHIGPLGALGAVLQRLPGEVAILLRATCVPRRHAELVTVSDNEASRVSAMARAARVLQSPGFVFMAIDAEGAARVDSEILGRPVSLAAGAFVLARLAQAPVVPVAVRWRRSRVEITMGQPIWPDAVTTMAGQFVSWFESYLAGRTQDLNSLARPLAVRGS